MKPALAALLIKLMGWGFIIFGVVFVSIAFAGYDGFAHWLAMFFDWTGHPHGDLLTRDARWFAAIMSGLSTGFGAVFTFVIAPLLTVPNRTAQNIAKRGGLISAFLWYIVDSTGSLAAGVPSNVAMNTLFLLAFIVPLLTVKFTD